MECTWAAAFVCAQGRISYPPAWLAAASPTPHGAVKTAPYNAKDKRAATARLRAGHARPLRGGFVCAYGRIPYPPAGVYGGGRFTDCRCRGRRPRRPAERSRPLPAMQKINGRQRQGCGPGMPGPYRVALFVRRGGFHIRPQACTAAEGLRTAAVGGGVPDAPRSGQDRSLQCKR